MVECFGVAVKAKWDTFAGRFRDRWTSRRMSSTVISDISCLADRASVACSFEAVFPVWELCASSMITAKFRSRRDFSVRIASIAKGKVWMVTTIMGVPFSIASLSCSLFGFDDVSLSIAAISPFWWSICWTASCSCPSRTFRSVTMITVSKIGVPSSRRSFTRSCAVHAIVEVFPDPALCSHR